MSWDAVGAIAELVGAIGVLVTVIYVAIQVRTNSKEVRENTLQSLLEKSVDLLGATGNQNPILLAALHKDSWGELTEDEAQIFRNWIMRNFQFFELVFLQYKKGRVEQEVMDAYEGRIIAFFERGTVRDWWEFRPKFTKSFLAYVDSIRGRET